MKQLQITKIIIIILTCCFISGCGISPQASATATAEASLPAIGHWTGTVSNSSGTISFDIDEQRNVSNFTFNIDVYGNKCSGTIESLAVDNSSFSLIMDKIEVINDLIFMGSIEGKFTHKEMKGTINILACGNSFFADNTREMSATLEK